MTRTLLISAGISCLIGGIIFMYFKNRMGRVEKKVDLMFQLIQEYEQTKSNYPQVSENQTPNEITTGNIDLINVSDDDFSEDSDSEEVSDEDEETIHISDNIDKNNIKSINLEGAETNSFDVDNLDDVSDLEESEIGENTEVLHLQKNDVIVEKQNPEIEFKEKVGGETSDKDGENHKNDTDEVDDVDDADDADDDDDVQSVIKKIIDKTDISLDGLSVKQLKQMCETKGFTNYKALRKNKLIALLQD